MTEKKILHLSPLPPALINHSELTNKKHTGKEERDFLHWEVRYSCCPLKSIKKKGVVRTVG